jgi:hypothetical protein
MLQKYKKLPTVGKLDRFCDLANKF